VEFGKVRGSTEQTLGGERVPGISGMRPRSAVPALACQLAKIALDDASNSTTPEAENQVDSGIVDYSVVHEDAIVLELLAGKVEPLLLNRDACNFNMHGIRPWQLIKRICARMPTKIKTIPQRSVKTQFTQEHAATKILKSLFLVCLQDAPLLIRICRLTWPTKLLSSASTGREFPASNLTNTTIFARC
jgi:hypothetical protein